MGLFNLLQGRPNLEKGLEKMRAAEGAVLLDVRTEQEYEEGHLEGSINLPVNNLSAINIEKEVPIFIYCFSGARAKSAESFLQKMGYHAVNIGGISGYNGKLVR